MLKTLILICATSVAPAGCTTDTALDVISGPDVANPMMCGFHGQAYIADTALASGHRDGEYVKIVCVRG